MDSRELDRKFMAKLRAKGLTDQDIRYLLLAPEKLKAINQVVTGIQVLSDDAKPYVLEEADLAGRS